MPPSSKLRSGAPGVATGWASRSPTLVSTLNTRDVVIAGWVTQLGEDFLNLVRADGRQVARGPGT